MKTTSETSMRFIAIEGVANSKNDAIKLCVEALYQAGFVEMSFLNDCLIREENYPTGLYLDTPVAIPHSKSSAIKVDGICYLRLKDPVTFKRLDDDEEEIETRHIFNIALKNGDGHLRMLQSMMQSFMNKTFMKRLEFENVADIPALLNNYLK